MYYSKVSHQVGADKYKDPMTFLIKYLQEKNILSVHLLNAQGYNDGILAENVSHKLVSARLKLTVPYSRECIKAMKRVKTHGVKFLATGVMHAIHDDFFIAARIN